jgi:diacylglycerol kinase family enzyme
VAFANGRYFGGGMQIAPEADPADGQLDAVLLGDFGRLEAIVNTPRVYGGTHLNLAKTKTARGRHFRVETWLTKDTAHVELDGETPGVLPLEVTVRPNAIRLRA